MFCEQFRKKIKKDFSTCSFAKPDKEYASFQVVIDKASQMYNLSILQRIDTCQERLLPNPYHIHCKVDFMKKNEQKIGNTDWHQRRQKYIIAREQLFAFIEENVIKNMHIFQL